MMLDFAVYRGIKKGYLKNSGIRDFHHQLLRPENFKIFGTDNKCGTEFYILEVSYING